MTKHIRKLFPHFPGTNEFLYSEFHRRINMNIRKRLAATAAFRFRALDLHLPPPGFE